MRTLIVLISALLPLAAFSADPSSRLERSKQLIAVLQSDAALYEKARACQQLGEFGTPDAVPALATLLSDAKLSAYARSGLEGIGGPSAAAALRQAIQTLQGPLRAGAVDSLGVLRDAEAVDLLARLAADEASEVRKEALLALGNIASPAAIRVVRETLAGTTSPARDAAAAACLLAADRNKSQGRRPDAVALYDLIRTAPTPLAIRVGATRGAILARDADQVSFAIEQLRSDEAAIRHAVLLTIREIPSDALATALNQEATRATGDAQVEIVLALADCHNAESIDALRTVLEGANAGARQAALVSLGKLGSNAAPILLSVLAHDQSLEEHRLLLAGLRALPGLAVDEVLQHGLETASASKVRLDLIDVLESRGATSAVPELIHQARRSDRQAQLASLNALRTLAGADATADLLDLAKAYADPELKEAVENSLAGICDRSGERACAVVLTELAHADKASQRQSCIRVLARGGCRQALPALEAATDDVNPDIAAEAVRELGHWPDSAPMERLLKALESGPTAAIQRQAFTSALDLASAAADDGQTPALTIVSWAERVVGAAQNRDDKLRLLGLLGRLDSPESLRLLQPFLADSDVRNEAAAAIVQVAPTVADTGDAAAARDALQQVSASAADSDIRNRAKEAAKKLPSAHQAVSLFDGRSLEGWEGNSRVWRVEDGLIRGGSMSGNPRNEFLATVRPYTNFILRLEYKLVGTEGFVNSGVQFRSVRVKNPPNEMSGYQADIGAGYSGCLYDESRRNTFLVRANEDQIKRLEHPGDWNRYEVQANGPHIQIRLNGEKTVDYSELNSALPQSGLIGLQIHGGNKAEVSFRNITLQED
jgi:HEAT repeat protein